MFSLLILSTIGTKYRHNPELRSLIGLQCVHGGRLPAYQLIRGDRLMAVHGF